MDTYFRFLIAFVFVIALIALLAWVARRYGLGSAALPRPGRARRLRLVEVLPLDAKRRLVLVRRDGVEHLILLGGQGDVAIETGISPGDGFGAALAAKTTGAAAGDPTQGQS